MASTQNRRTLRRPKMRQQIKGKEESDSKEQQDPLLSGCVIQVGLNKPET